MEVRDEAAGGPQQGRLAAARAPGEDDQLAGADLERDVGEGVAPGVRVGVADAVQGQRRGRLGSWSRAQPRRTQGASPERAISDREGEGRGVGVEVDPSDRRGTRRRRAIEPRDREREDAPPRRHRSGRS